MHGSRIQDIVPAGLATRAIQNMRFSKKTPKSVSISDVLQVVSTSDLEAFNTAMEASFAHQEDASFAQQDDDELIGAECWMSDGETNGEQAVEYADPLRLTLQDAARKKTARHDIARHGLARHDQVWLADFDAA